MEIGKYVAVPLERYEQLIRAEHDANQLKALIEKKNNDYGTIGRDELLCLGTIYFGDKEETK